MNGQWDFAFDDENIGVLEGWSHTVRGDRKINVPFTYETGKSGIGDERPHGVIWYWKNITITNEFNNPVTGWNLLYNSADDYYKETLIYNQTFTVRDYFWPIVDAETWRNKNLKQNYGW